MTALKADSGDAVNQNKRHALAVANPLHAVAALLCAGYMQMAEFSRIAANVLRIANGDDCVTRK